jgi:GNAT superfamily N-acetyltransferase
MKQVDCTVYYLEMHQPMVRRIPPPRDSLTVLHVMRPSIPYYRFLYNTVGRDYYWDSRARLTDEQLDLLLADPRLELHVLHVDGAPAGMAELDRRQPNEIELVQFGLMPEFIGQGLGRYFLDWTIQKAWSDRPDRFWLHTCDLDHPAALSNYQQAGFVLYHQETIQREIAP